MRSFPILFLSAFLLSACGSSDSASGPKAQPQLNPQLVGAWRTACAPAGEASSQSDITIAANGTIHSADRVYGSTDCTGETIDTSSTDMKYRVLATNGATSTIEFFDIVSTPPITGARVSAFTVEMTLLTPDTAGGKITAGTLVEESGASRPLTAEEIAAQDPMSLTRI